MQLRIAIGIVAGAVRGAQTLVQASAVADRWGTRNYGSINGVFAAPITAVTALGPALGPVVGGWGRGLRNDGPDHGRLRGDRTRVGAILVR